jgi:hypothetical protein
MFDYSLSFYHSSPSALHLGNQVQTKIILKMETQTNCHLQAKLTVNFLSVLHPSE